MKKGVKIGVGISLIIVFAIIVTLLIFNTKEEEIIKEYNLYTIMYSASYNDYKVFEDEEKFRVIKDTFFENNNLLVIEGEVNSEVHECEVNNENANVTIYTASPLATADEEFNFTADEEFNFDLYLIPINKNIPDNNINVEVTTYPDKEY